MGGGLTGEGLVEALGFGELGGGQPACHNGRRSLVGTTPPVCIDRRVILGAPCRKNTSCSTLNLIIQLFLSLSTFIWYRFNFPNESSREETFPGQVNLSGITLIIEKPDRVQLCSPHIVRH